MGIDWAYVLQLAGGIVLLSSAGAVLVKGGRWVAGFWRKINDFLDDWNGEPARPGREAVPGVLERIVTLEQLSRAVVHEVSPNSGGSMKDTLGRVEAQLGITAPVPTDPTYAPPSGALI